MNKRLLAFALSCNVLLAGCHSEQSEVITPSATKQSFTLAVLPDTQKYSRYSPERFNVQTQWIADNYQQQNIAFTVHLGDVVDLPKSEQEWLNARAAMQILEANPATPYSILAGNHDLLSYQTAEVNNNTDYDDQRQHNEPFLQHFPVSLQQNNFATFKGADSTGFNSYHIFNGAGRDYLVLALDWRVSAQTIAWAQQVLQQHANMPTILTAHQIINVHDDGKTPIFEQHGSMLWQQLIANNDQIFLTFNGHHHGETEMVAKNNFGNDVYMILTDYQSGFWGGNGMMQTVVFNETDNKLSFKSFSPWVMAIDESERLPQDELSRREFDLPLNFEQRFSHLNQDNSANHPGNIAGTLGYWVLDQHHQVTTAETANIVFRDLSGKGNNMALTAKSGTELTIPVEQFFSLTDDAPNFGYAKGSASFNGSKSRGGYYLQSVAPSMLMSDKQVNNQAGVLTQYTLEAIVKISPNWSAQENKWAGIFTHKPSSAQVCQHYQMDCGDGDASNALNTSSLNEMQFISTSANSTSMANWSWELAKDYWYHVVIVNDGEFATMYVDGAKVMRSAEKVQQGMVTILGAQWLIGAGTWQGEISSLFNGNVAEIRLNNRALASSEWLINSF